MAESSFGYYPDFDVAWDYKVVHRYKTQIATSFSGKEQRRKAYPAPASDGTGHRGGYALVTCNSGNYTVAQRATVADFLDSVEGAFRAFYLYRRDSYTFTNYDVGTITSQSSIIIPFKDSAITSVTSNNVSVGYTVTLNVGTGGEDRINFNAGLTTGTIRVNITGRERLLVRATDDDVVEQFLANVVSQKTILALSFKQVR